MKHLGDITKIDFTKVEPVDARMHKVYMYTFPNGKIYIGTTSLSIEERRDCGYHHNKELESAMRLFGWKNIVKTILCDGLDKKTAYETEKQYIKKHNATDPNIGYNISLGGETTFLGLRHSPEYKKKISELNKGKCVSEQTRKRLRIAQKNKIGVICFCPDKKIEFDSLSMAAQYVCGYKTNIKRACESGKYYKGYKWELKEVI